MTTTAALSPSSYGIAAGVRALIAQVEGGRGFDMEWTGPAFDICAEARGALAARLQSGADALIEEIEGSIERFAREAASMNLYARLVITDRTPEDLPDYDPCLIRVYDGLQATGTDFSTVVRRATIYGTMTSSVNMTDLRAYFESGRKRQLLLYAGTDSIGDARALQAMLAQLPAILEAAGMPQEAIADMIAAVQAGNVPPVVLRLLQQAVQIAQIRAAVPEGAPDAQAPASPLRQRLARLEADFKARLATLTARGGAAPPVMLKALKLLAAPPSPRGLTLLRAMQNPGPARNTTGVQPLIRALRATARDRSIRPEMRRDLAAALRQIRGGSTAVPRAEAGILYLRTRMTAWLRAGTPPAFVQAIIPPLIQAGVALGGPGFALSVAGPGAVRAARQAHAPLPVLNRLEHILTTAPAAPRHLARMAATAVPALVSILPPKAVAAAMAPVAGEIKPAPVQPPLAPPGAAFIPVNAPQIPVLKPALSISLKTDSASVVEKQVEGKPATKPVVAEKAVQPDKQAKQEKSENQKQAPAPGPCGKAFCACAGGPVKPAEPAISVSTAEQAVYPRSVTRADAIMAKIDKASGQAIGGTAHQDALAEAIRQIESAPKNKQDTTKGHACGPFCAHTKPAAADTAAPKALKITKKLDRDSLKNISFEP